MSGVVRYAHGKRNHVMTPAENGPFVRACDYDTLRAQLEAAELGQHRAYDEQPTWAEITQHWKARAEAAEAECVRLKASLGAIHYHAGRKGQHAIKIECEEAVPALAEIARTKEQQA